jgi:hypothetical protein
LKIEDVLILEPDKEFAVRLVQALNKISGYTISVVPTVKEACLHLVQGRKDLAFIPVNEGAKIIRSLRAVQPDLRLILVTPTAGIEIPVTYSGRVQGVLIKSLIDVELPVILEGVIDHPLVAESKSGTDGEEITTLDTAVLGSVLNKANLGRLVQTAVFASGSNLLAYCGKLKESEAATVAIRVGKGWYDMPYRSRLQFTHLPARAGDLLLYSHLVDGDYLITLVALPETPLSDLRHEAERMAAKLRNVVAGKAVAQTGLLGGGNGRGVDGRPSFAIVWRPVDALPVSLHVPLRRAIERLAVTNACVLTHTEIKSDLIHLVVTCPPGRDNTWAAYLFKNGSEQTLQQEYSEVANLWDTGFYATESTEPLEKAELNLFLDHNRSK